MVEFDQDIGGWDVSNVKNMHGMFIFNKKFNQDISRWNVSNVKDMGFMFKCAIFNQDISSWEVSQVHIMQHMFKRSHFDQDISNWNVQNVPEQHLKYMFEGSPMDNLNFHLSDHEKETRGLKHPKK